MMDVAVYKGEMLLCIGTMQECATQLGVKPKTIKFYTMPAYHNRIAKRKNPRNYLIAVRLDDE